MRSRSDRVAHPHSPPRFQSRLGCHAPDRRVVFRPHDHRHKLRDSRPALRSSVAMTTLRRLLCAAPAAVVFSLSTTPRPALATPSAGATPADAQALFLEGRTAFRAGDFSLACDKLSASLRLERTVGTLLNLGLCEEKRSRFAAAAKHLRAVLASVGIDDDRAKLAEARLAAIAPRLSYVRFTGETSGRVAVTLDGMALDVAGASSPLEIDAGDHVVVFTLGSARRIRSFAVTEGSTALVELLVMSEREPAPVASSAPVAGRPPLVAAPELPRSVAAGGRPSPLAWALLGLGAAGLTVSAAGGFVALREKQTVRDHCPGRVCDPTGVAARDRGATAVTVANIGFAGAVAALAPGLWLSLRPAPSGTHLALQGSFQ